MPPHPLSGVMVMEFATFIAVPFMASLMADLGARVIKVEPVTGDLSRPYGWPRNAKTYQGKEALALDLKDPRCQEVIQKLAARADILIHNYRPGVPERLGIGYETLRKINPRLIYIYGASYGSTGPHSHRAAFHPIAGAIAGGPRHHLGKALPPPPGQALSLDEVQSISNSIRQANEGNPDFCSAFANAAAALMALYARERTGRGQYVETWMLCSNLYANAGDALSYPGKPERMQTDVEYNGFHALYRLYPAREGWVFLGCLEEEEWPALAEALGLPGLLGDARFATGEARLRHDGDLARILGDAFKTRGAEAWQELLTARDVCCVRVADGSMGAFVNTTPWVKEQAYLAETEHPSLGGRYWRYAPPYFFSQQTGRAGPNIALGEHTLPILRELGYAEETIEAMLADGVLASTDPWKAAAKA